MNLSKLTDQIELLEGVNERTTDITVYRLVTVVRAIYERMNDMQTEINDLHNRLNSLETINTHKVKRVIDK